MREEKRPVRAFNLKREPLIVNREEEKFRSIPWWYQRNAQTRYDV